MRAFALFLFCLQLLVAVVGFPGAGHSLPRQLEAQHAVTVNGTERSYRLYVPTTYKPDTPLPLVLVFHGGRGRSDSMADTTLFHRLAETKGFIVAFPQGIDNLWYNISNAPFAIDKSIDDVAFVRAMLNQIRSQYAVDPKRIFATGLSLGGILSYELACRMADTFAAVAVVSGTMTTTDCHPASPVAVLHIHAKNDENVPFDGGRGRLTARGNTFPPVTDGLDFWRKENGCGTGRDETFQATESACWTYAPCVSKKPVDLCLVDGGHQWPGQQDRMPWQVVTGTEVTKTFPASEKIWDFFAAHPK